VSSPDYERIHPLTILVNLERAIRRMIFVVVVVVINMFQGEGFDQFEIFGAALGGFIVIDAVIRYFTYGYRIRGGHLEIKQGVLMRSNRSIPLDRIQNINFQRSVTHRLTGLVDLEIETAAGSKAEASISALDLESAERLRRQLVSQGVGGPVPDRALDEPEAAPLYTASLKQLALAGATENRWPAIIGLLVAAGAVGSTLTRIIIDAIESAAGEALSGPRWMVYVGGILLVAVLGWLLSIGASIVTYYNFQVRLLDGRFRRTYGLLNTVENIVPLRRIQLLVVRQSLLQRLLGYCRIFVDTAGGFGGGGNDGDAAASAAKSSLISPLSKLEDVPVIGRIALPAEYTFAKAHRISPLTMNRRIRLSIIVGVVIASAFLSVSLFIASLADGSPPDRFLEVWRWPIFAALLLGIPALGTWEGWLSYKTARWQDQESVLAIRLGALGRTAWFVPVSKIQTISLTENPGQRRLNLVSLDVTTAAASGGLVGGTVTIPDLDRSVAEGLYASLHGRAKQGARLNPDGF
jgi:putative membrane protein